MDRQIVLHEADAVGVGIMDIDEFAHAVGVVHGGAVLGDLDVAPATMRVEGNEEIDGAVAAVLVIVAAPLSPLRRERPAGPPPGRGRGGVVAKPRPRGGPGPRAEEEDHLPYGGRVAAC